MQIATHKQGWGQEKAAVCLPCGGVRPHLQSQEQSWGPYAPSFWNATIQVSVWRLWQVFRRKVESEGSWTHTQKREAFYLSIRLRQRIPHQGQSSRPSATAWESKVRTDISALLKWHKRKHLASRDNLFWSNLIKALRKILPLMETIHTVHAIFKSISLQNFDNNSHFLISGRSNVSTATRDSTARTYRSFMKTNALKGSAASLMLARIKHLLAWILSNQLKLRSRLPQRTKSCLYVRLAIC